MKIIFLALALLAGAVGCGKPHAYRVGDMVQYGQAKIRVVELLGRGNNERGPLYRIEVDGYAFAPGNSTVTPESGVLSEELLNAYKHAGESL